MKNDRHCPYCGKDRYDVVFKKAYMVDICHCLHCGLYWTNPIFKFSKLHSSVYETIFGLELKSNKIPKQFLLTGRAEYLPKDYSYIIDGLSKYEFKGRKMLEFGCSWGYFLLQAKARGFDVAGVDISEKWRQIGTKTLGLRIFPDIDSLISKGEKFDVIVTLFTLEHMTYIGDIFKKFQILLEDSGILVMTVPLFDIFKGDEAYMAMGLAHPLGFSQKFFIDNLPKEGLEAKTFDGTNIICKKIVTT